MIINVGSINIDHVYRVAALPKAGETLAAKSYERYLGGKGANQSIAIQRAGGDVIHVGAVGADGDWALEQLKAAGLDTGHVTEVDAPTGHAIIAVDDAGENSIVIVPGANGVIALDRVAAAMETVDPSSSWLLLQNETNATDEIVREGRSRGFKICYSAAPFVARTTLPLLNEIDLLVVNEGEANALAAAAGVSLDALGVPELLITKGAVGAVFQRGAEHIHQSAFTVDPVDTTGAGDTFLGAFLAHYAKGAVPQEAMRFASAASAIQVTRPGAADAIPDAHEIEAFLKERT